MSKIGKKNILVPKEVNYSYINNIFIATGPKGKKEVILNENFSIIKISDNKIFLKKNVSEKKYNSFYGLYRTLINNAIVGVSVGFTKQLKIIGIGFKVNLINNNILELNLGFSHIIKYKINDLVNTKVDIKNNIIILESINSEILGNVAAKIRSFKIPEPYNGKGIFYINEIIKRKEGKSKKTNK